MVRAKFMVTEVKHIHIQGSDPSNVACQVTLAAVWGNGTGNQQWSKATPQGQMQMTITNPDAIDKFELGESYYLDFTPAEAKPA